MFGWVENREEKKGNERKWYVFYFLVEERKMGWALTTQVQKKIIRIIL